MSKKHICAYCDFTSDNKEKYQQHLYTKHDIDTYEKKEKAKYLCPVIGCNRFFTSELARKNHIQCCHNKNQKVMKINKEEFLKEEKSSIHHKTELQDYGSGREPSPLEEQLIIAEKNLNDLEDMLEKLANRLQPISKDFTVDEVDHGIDKAEENIVKRIQKINSHISELKSILDGIVGRLEI